MLKIRCQYKGTQCNLPNCMSCIANGKQLPKWSFTVTETTEILSEIFDNAMAIGIFAIIMPAHEDYPFTDKTELIEIFNDFNRSITP